MCLALVAGPEPYGVHSSDRHERHHERPDRPSERHADHCPDKRQDKKLLRLHREWQGTDVVGIVIMVVVIITVVVIIVIVVVAVNLRYSVACGNGLVHFEPCVHVVIVPIRQDSGVEMMSLSEWKLVQRDIFDRK